MFSSFSNSGIVSAAGESLVLPPAVKFSFVVLLKAPVKASLFLSSLLIFCLAVLGATVFSTGNMAIVRGVAVDHGL